MSVESSAGAEKLWTPANIITLVRICLVPVFVLALLSPWPQWMGLEWMSDQMKSLVAAGVFIIISCTDWIDGYLARSRNEVTDFGKFMDPLADKILVAAALLALVELSVLPSWPVLIILVREFIVSGIRMIAATKGEVIAASWYGKAKTVFQIIAIVLFIVKDSLVLPNFESVMQTPLYLLSWLVMFIALALTIVSMVDYIAKARHLIGFGPRKSEREPEAPESNGSAPSPGCVSGSSEAHYSAERDAQRLAAEVVEAATRRGIRLGTAESLTGGMICSALTSVPGSSSVVRGGIASYSSAVKANVLHVDEHVLLTEGAVNEETARMMAAGAIEALDADLVVSVTGIAGPTGAEPGKPVGTVCFGVATRNDVRSFTRNFNGDRESVRLQTLSCALETLASSLEHR